MIPGPAPRDDHARRKAANRNKKFATLDLQTPEGLALFKRMLPRFDVLIEIFRLACLSEGEIQRLARNKVI